MRGFIQLLFFSIIIAVSLTACQRKQCVPIACVTRTLCDGDNCKDTIRQYWIYDQLGRISIDSINPADTNAAAPARTRHYHYVSDSISVDEEYEDTLVISLNKNGFPQMAYGKWSETFHSFFNSDGTIKEIRSTRLKGSGGKEAAGIWQTIVDSIIFQDGNIVAYRSTTDSMSFTVNCSYYTDKAYTSPFNPNDKILSYNSGLSPHTNVQVYSRCLLKTIEFKGAENRFDYQLDTEGKVTHMNITFKRPYGTWTNQYSYKYSCQ